jgi:hypothetical protein
MWYMKKNKFDGLNTWRENYGIFLARKGRKPVVISNDNSIAEPDYNTVLSEKSVNVLGSGIKIPRPDLSVARQVNRASE